jgi:hypothetical protein
MWKARVQFAPIEQPGRIASIPRLPGRRYVEVRSALRQKLIVLPWPE